MQTSGIDKNVTVNGVTICYDDFGIGDTSMIFVHGFPFDKSSWKPQMDFFKNTHRVISFDHRGFGQSTTAEENVSINLLADDLVKLMDILSINKAILCGLSMGGYVVLNAVSRYPERIEALILSDTQCIADTQEVKEKRNKIIQLIESGGLQVFVDEFVNSIFSKQTLNTNHDLINSIKKAIQSTKEQTIISTLRALSARWETCSSLKEINIPTLILCGKEDKITTPAQSEFLQQNIKNSLLHIITNAGHLSNLEQPEEFNKQMSDFISGFMK